MKSKVLALLIPALLAAGAAHAAEVYNKDGNKLDLYGKVDGLHYFSDNSAKDGDQSYARLGFKGETQINDQLTGYGQWEYNIQANNTESSTNQSWTRLAFAGFLMIRRPPRSTLSSSSAASDVYKRQRLD